MSRFEELQARLEELSPIPVNMPEGRRLRLCLLIAPSAPQTAWQTTPAWGELCQNWRLKPSVRLFSTTTVSSIGFEKSRSKW